jgi:hypothetical protein
VIPSDQVNIFSKQGDFFESDQNSDEEQSLVEIGCKVFEVNKILKDGSTQ